MANRDILSKPASETEYDMVTRGLLEANGPSAKSFFSTGEVPDETSLSLTTALAT